MCLCDRCGRVLVNDSGGSRPIAARVNNPRQAVSLKETTTTATQRFNSQTPRNPFEFFDHSELRPGLFFRKILDLAMLSCESRGLTKPPGQERLASLPCLSLGFASRESESGEVE